MLELAILGLLQEKAMHGYELKMQLTQKLGHFWQVSYGSLYPTLRRLHDRGAIEPVFEGSDTRRSKNVYRITEKGQEEFLELIEDRTSSTWEEDKFPLRFAFFRYVKPEIRLRLLQRRREYLQDKLADLRETMRSDEERIDSYTLSLMRHGLEATAADIEWLDELIAAERRAVQEAPPREKTPPAREEAAPAPEREPRKRTRTTYREPPTDQPNERAPARSRP